MTAADMPLDVMAWPGIQDELERGRCQLCLAAEGHQPIGRVQVLKIEQDTRLAGWYPIIVNPPADWVTYETYVMCPVEQHMTYGTIGWTDPS